MSLIGASGNSNRDFGDVPAGVCQACDGQRVLWTGGFGGEPNRSVSCPSCRGTGKT